MSDNTLLFDTEQIAAISKAALGHEAQWEAIWNRVRARLSATAAEALSREPGGSLEQRTADYHRRTQQYRAQLQARAGSVSRIGTTAADYNRRMAQTLAGR